MTAYTIELDDGQRDMFIRDLDNLLGGDLALNIAKQLLAQIPIPLPVKIGAVVRTSDNIAWVLADPIGHDGLRWRNAETGDWQPDPSGVVAEVLSPGVDL